MVDYAKNLRTASDIVLRKIGATDRLSLTQSQRLQYNQTLAEFIVARPNDFSAAAYDAASYHLNNPGSREQLVDASLDFGVVADSVASTISNWGFTVSSGVMVGLAVVLLAPHVRKAIA